MIERASEILCLALLLGFMTVVPPAAQEQEDRSETPRESGLVEKARARAGQIDITVTGPPGIIDKLGREDFELVINSRFLDEFSVDSICRAEDSETTETATTETTEEATPEIALPVVHPSYLIYLDQHHLTSRGRVNSIDTAKVVAARLIEEGGRVMVVSAGETVETFVELTDDLEAVTDALNRVQRDRTQWDPFPQGETIRLENINEELRDGDIADAKTLARQYAREEARRTDKALRLFALTMGRFAEVNPPKSVLYFADTMRRNAGEHYLSLFFGTNATQTDYIEDPTENMIRQEAKYGQLPFDAVLKAAAAHGARLYTVQAEGMRADFRRSPRVRDAQSSLASLSTETGGRHFLNGVPAKKIATRITDDLNCVYLMTFDATDLPEDQPLRVVVRTTRDDVEVHARGQVVLASDSSRKTSRLLAAFTGMQEGSATLPVSAAMVPTGWVDGRFRGMVQLAAPGSPVPEATWEVGASLVARGEVAKEYAKQLTIPLPGLPVIYEQEMEFRPGTYELRMVALDRGTDLIGSVQIEGEWPDINDNRATVTSSAVLQPLRGVFARDDEVRSSGPVAVGAGRAAKANLPTALVGLVCRGKKNRGPLTAERRLVGESAVNFEPIEIELDDERCAQIRDVIRADTMTAGNFAYEVRVFDQDFEELAFATTQFTVTQEGAELQVDGTVP